MYVCMYLQPCEERGGRSAVEACDATDSCLVAAWSPVDSLCDDWLKDPELILKLSLGQNIAFTQFFTEIQDHNSL